MVGCSENDYEMLGVTLLSQKGLCHAGLALEWYYLMWDMLE